MASFSLIFKRTGAPVSDAEIRTQRRAFRHHAGELIELRCHPSLVIVIARTASFNREVSIVRHADDGELTIGQVAPRSMGLCASLGRSDVSQWRPLPVTPCLRICWSATTVVIQTDRCASRHVCYASTPSTLIAGSEPRLVISHADVSTDPDLETVFERLSFHPATPGKSVYRQVSSLLPNACLRVDDVSLTELDLALPTVDVDVDTAFADWAERIRRASLDAIDAQYRARLGTDSRTCVHAISVSGGLDSSSLAGLLAERGLDDHFAIGMIGYPGMACDERPYQQAVVDRCRFREARWFDFRGLEIERDLCEAVQRSRLPLDRFDPPEDDLMRWCRSSGVDYLTLGVGGDELFLRTDYTLPDLLRSGRWARARSWFGEHSVRDMSRELLGVLPWQLRRGWRFHRLPAWLTPTAGAGWRLAGSLTRAQRRSGVDGVADWLRHGMLLNGRRTINREFTEFRQAEYGVTILEPFTTPELVDLCAVIPLWMRGDRADSRALQRQVYREMLPPAVYRRRDKAWFDQPAAQLIRSRWFRDLFRNLELEKAGLVNGTVVRAMHARLLADLDAGRQIRRVRPLPTVVGMELWWRQHVLGRTFPY